MIDLRTYSMAQNYEQLRSVTDSLYNEKAELEFAINIVKDFEGTYDEWLGLEYDKNLKPILK